MMYNETPAQSQAGFHKPVILVVEDDESIGTFVVQALVQETPYDAVLVTDGLQALRLVDEVKPHLFITDYCLPHMNGIELYDRIHSIFSDTPAIIMSAYLPEQEVKERRLVGLNKPFELDELLDTVDRLLA